MKYTVTVQVNHPDAGGVVHRSLDGEGTVAEADETLLIAVSAVQDRLGVRSSYAFEAEASASFKKIEAVLDELGVASSAQDPMRALVARLNALAAEVRTLRLERAAGGDRDWLATETRKTAEALADVRRELIAPNESSDVDLAGLVQTMRRELKSKRDTVRDVRVAMNLGHGTRDEVLVESVRSLRLEKSQKLLDAEDQLNDSLVELEKLGAVVAAATGTAEPTTHDALMAGVRTLAARSSRLERVLIGLGLPPGYWMDEASDEELFERVDASADAADRWWSLTPERLFEASREVSARRGSEPIPMIEPKGWDEIGDSRRLWWSSMAEQLGGAEVGTTVPSPSAEQLARIWEDLTRSELGASSVGRAVSPKLVERMRALLDVVESTPRGQRSRAESERLAPEKAFGLAEMVVTATWEHARSLGHKPDWSPPLYPWKDMIGISSGFWRGVAERLAPMLAGSTFVTTSLLPVSPEELARATHEAQQEIVTPGAPSFMSVEWGAQHEASREHQLRVAQATLNRLPSYAAEKPAKSDVDAARHTLRLVARSLAMSFPVDANIVTMGDMVVTAENQRKTELGRLERAYSELSRTHDEVLAAGNEANGDMIAYRDKVLFALGRLGVPVDVADASPAEFEAKVGAWLCALEEWSRREYSTAKEHGLIRALESARGVSGVEPEGSLVSQAARMIERLLELWHEAKDRPSLFTVCAPRPEDWRVLLTPVEGPTIQREVRSGAVLDLVDAGEFTATLDYVGSDPVRPEGTLLLPSVTPEQLGRAWMECDLSVPSAWNGLPLNMREAFVFHAKRVIERLTPQALADASVRDSVSSWGKDWAAHTAASAEFWPKLVREMRKGAGVFFARDESGAITEARAFHVDDSAMDRFAEVRRPGSMASEVRKQSITVSVDRSKPLTSLGSDSAEVRALLGQVSELGDALRRKEKVIADIAEAMGLRGAGGAVEQVIISEAREIESFRRSHRACVGAVGLERAHIEELAEALNVDAGPKWTWRQLVDMARTSREQVRSTRLEANALLEVRRILGVSEKLHPSGVVGAVRNLFASWKLMEEWYPRVIEALDVRIDTAFDENIPAAVGKALDTVRDLKRAVADGLVEKAFDGEMVDRRRSADAVATLLEAAGMDIAADSADVAVQKAGDAAAVLRSWPDVLRAVSAFDGDEVEQPDEVAPTLANFVQPFLRGEDYAARLSGLERLLAAHGGTDVVQEPDTLYTRYDRLIGRLFDAAKEAGAVVGVPYTPGESKTAYADLVAMHARNYVARPSGQDNTMVDMLKPVIDAAEAEKKPKTIKVLSQTQMWMPGPTTEDPSAHKLWHVGCGGEVLPPFTAEGKAACQSCGQVCVPDRGAPAITVTEVPASRILDEFDKPAEGDE